MSCCLNLKRQKFKPSKEGHSCEVVSSSIPSKSYLGRMEHPVEAEPVEAGVENDVIKEESTPEVEAEAETEAGVVGENSELNDNVAENEGEIEQEQPQGEGIDESDEPKVEDEAFGNSDDIPNEAAEEKTGEVTEANDEDADEGSP